MLFRNRKRMKNENFHSPQNTTLQYECTTWKSQCVLSPFYFIPDSCTLLISPFFTFTNPIIHLFYPPKFCIIIVCNFSWDMKMSQEKSKTMPMQISWGGGGKRGVLWDCASREFTKPLCSLWACQPRSCGKRAAPSNE